MTVIYQLRNIVVILFVDICDFISWPIYAGNKYQIVHLLFLAYASISSWSCEVCVDAGSICLDLNPAEQLSAGAEMLHPPWIGSQDVNPTIKVMQPDNKIS